MAKQQQELNEQQAEGYLGEDRVDAEQLGVYGFEDEYIFKYADNAAGK